MTGLLTVVAAVVDDATEARGRTVAEEVVVAGLVAAAPEPVDVLLATEDGRTVAVVPAPAPAVDVRGAVAAGRAAVVVGRVGVEVVEAPAGRVTPGLAVVVVAPVDPTGRRAAPAVALTVEVRGPVAVVVFVGVAGVRPAARRAEGPVAVVVCSFASEIRTFGKIRSHKFVCSPLQRLVWPLWKRGPEGLERRCWT